MGIFNRIFFISRYIILLGVFGSIITSFILFAIALFSNLRSLINAITKLGDANAVHAVAIDVLRHADDYLIATAMFIVGTGLYSLYIDKTHLPQGLAVKSLNDLKNRLIGVMTVAMAMTFLGESADWDGTRNLLTIGLSIAAVIVSLAIFIWLSNIGIEKSDH
jgi:uncharacterized membrane protein YqhA